MGCRTGRAVGLPHGHRHHRPPGAPATETGAPEEQVAPEQIRTDRVTMGKAAPGRRAVGPAEGERARLRRSATHHRRLATTHPSGPRPSTAISASTRRGPPRRTCNTTRTAPASWACSAARPIPPSAASASSRAGTSAGAVGMHGAGTALVAGVQRGQQVDHLGAPHLADHDPVRAHPQRLPHQVPQRDRPRALDIGLPGHQPHHVRVRRRAVPRRPRRSPVARRRRRPRAARRAGSSCPSRFRRRPGTPAGRRSTAVSAGQRRAGQAPSCRPARRDRAGPVAAPAATGRCPTPRPAPAPRAAGCRRCSRASTWGCASSSRRPAAVASRRASRCTAASSANRTGPLPARTAVHPDIRRRVHHHVGGRPGRRAVRPAARPRPAHVAAAGSAGASRRHYQHRRFGPQRRRQCLRMGCLAAVDQSPLDPPDDLVRQGRIGAHRGTTLHAAAIPGHLAGSVAPEAPAQC